MAAKLMEFFYQELAKATNNFSSDNKIGQGRFGAVYFAKLRCQKAAIKNMDVQASTEFLSELMVLKHDHHLNLANILHGTGDNVGNIIPGSEPLAWSTRVQIALDSARGLEYIHEHTVPVYIHRDVKPANILIYKDFCEKVLEIHQVTNFGLTKLREVGSSLSLHTRLVGTFRYMPPVGSECFNQLKVFTAAAPIILLAIKSEENKLQEVMVGLAANVFTFMSSQESSYVFQEAKITEVELASILVHILKKHKYPATKVLRIRRFAIKFEIWMMKDKVKNIYTFKHMGMEKVLEGVLETTSELESFNVFSSTVGFNRHNLTIHSLVETAFKLLENR
nr:lysM domain receptor-like kinase 3 [Arachis hypogaea]